MTSFILWMLAVTLAATNAGAEFCDGKATGTYPDPEDCTRFYQCVDGTTYSTPCQTGLKFNPDTLSCDWPENVQCATDAATNTAPSISTASTSAPRTATPSSFCSGKPDGKHSDPNSCYNFYECVSGAGSLQQCPQDQVFRPDYRICDWECQFPCSQSTTPSITVSTATQASTKMTQANSVTMANPATTQAPPIDGVACQRRVCYYTNWSQYRKGDINQFFPDDVDPFLCTHINYAFATLKDNALAPYEWNDDPTGGSIGNYQKVVNLKQLNPSLKVLIAVGGWAMGSDLFTKMVATQATRAHFVSTTIDFLRTRGFDGLDLDWEFPADRGSPPEDKGKFTSLVRELKAAFLSESASTGQEALLLTAAVSAGKSTTDASYDVPAISAEMDFINLMTYDFHGGWETKTGHNSPLYAGNHETGAHRYLNIEWAANYWSQQGCPKDKLVIGLPLYGRSFTLTTSNTGVGAPATPGTPGEFTGEAGFVSYYEVCKMIAAGAKTTFLEDQHVPYLTLGNQWVGYDNPSSLREKVRFIRNNGFGGAMVWALDLDDFTGTYCGQEAYPLMEAINEECIA